MNLPAAFERFRDATNHAWTRGARCALAGLSSVVAASAAVGTAEGAAAKRADAVAVRRLFAGPDEVAAGHLRLPDPRASAVASQTCLHVIRCDPDEPTVLEARFRHAGGRVESMLLSGRAEDWSIDFRVEANPVPLPPVKVPHDPSPVLAGTVEASLAPFGIDATTTVALLDAPPGVVVAHVEPADPRRDCRENAPIAVAWRDESMATLVASRASFGDGGTPGPSVLEFIVEAWLPCAASGDSDRPLVERARSGRPLALERLAGEAVWADGTREAAMQTAAVAGADERRLRFARAVPGDAVVTVQAEVVEPDGRRRARSVTLLTRVADGGTRLGETVVLETGVLETGVLETGAPSGNPDWIDLLVPVSTDRDVVLAAIEIWAISGSRERPLGWLGGLARVEREHAKLAPRSRGFEAVRLGCEADLLELEAGERFEARDVRIHARDGFELLAYRQSMTAMAGPFSPAAADRSRLPAAARWMGRPGVATLPSPPRSTLLPGPGSHVHALVHGYCADANPWPPEQFGTERWTYLLANQNLSNDAFALDLLARGADFKSYGVVGHSQGGSAALHLYAFYFSPLDWAGPGRLIQTVGTPFEGTPIAGVLAALAEVFGVQCGTNYDMSPEGAALWLSAIPMAPRSRVHTYTTSYPAPGWAGYCNLATSFFLAFPEDGVTEHASGHIVGANDRGLVYGWCHVDGMRHPDQALDASRNATMRQEGAR